MFSCGSFSDSWMIVVLLLLDSAASPGSCGSLLLTPMQSCLQCNVRGKLEPPARESCGVGRSKQTACPRFQSTECRTTTVGPEKCTEKLHLVSPFLIGCQGLNNSSMLLNQCVLERCRRLKRSSAVASCCLVLSTAYVRQWGKGFRATRKVG